MAEREVCFSLEPTGLPEPLGENGAGASVTVFSPSRRGKDWLSTVSRWRAFAPALALDSLQSIIEWTSLCRTLQKLLDESKAHCLLLQTLAWLNDCCLLPQNVENGTRMKMAWMWPLCPGQKP